MLEKIENLAKPIFVADGDRKFLLMTGKI